MGAATPVLLLPVVLLPPLVVDLVLSNRHAPALQELDDVDALSPREPDREAHVLHVDFTAFQIVLAVVADRPQETHSPVHINILSRRRRLVQLLSALI